MKTNSNEGISVNGLTDSLPPVTMTVGGLGCALALFNFGLMLSLVESGFSETKCIILKLQIKKVL